MRQTIQPKAMTVSDMNYAARKNLDEAIANFNDDSSESSTADHYEVLQMKKINQKFTKLMSFNLDKSLNKTESLLGQYKRMQERVSNLSPLELAVQKHNFQTRFRESGSLKQQHRVRFSLDNNKNDGRNDAATAHQNLQGKPN